MRRAAALLLPGLLAAAVALAQDARGFVAAVEARLRAARALPDPAARQAACRQALAEAFDAQALARTAAGPRWEGFDAALRSELAAATGARLGRECAPLLAAPEAGAAEVVRERATSSGWRLTTRLARAGAGDLILVWAVAPGGAMGWRLTDMTVDGIGVAATLRSELDALLAVHEGDARAAVAALAADGRR